MGPDPNRHEAVGTGLKAAVASFLFFAVGALIPVLPYLFGLEGTVAVLSLFGLIRSLRPTGPSEYAKALDSP